MRKRSVAGARDMVGAWTKVVQLEEMKENISMVGGGGGRGRGRGKGRRGRRQKKAKSKCHVPTGTNLSAACLLRNCSVRAALSVQRQR